MMWYSGFPHDACLGRFLMICNFGIEKFLLMLIFKKIVDNLLIF